MQFGIKVFEKFAIAYLFQNAREKSRDYLTLKIHLKINYSNALIDYLDSGRRQSFKHLQMFPKVFANLPIMLENLWKSSSIYGNLRMIFETLWKSSRETWNLHSYYNFALVLHFSALALQYSCIPVLAIRTFSNFSGVLSHYKICYCILNCPVPSIYYTLPYHLTTTLVPPYYYQCNLLPPALLFRVTRGNFSCSWFVAQPVEEKFHV